MSLFVTAFFIQWWVLAVFGVCQLSGNVPPLLLNLMTIFSNIGGLLNGIVFIFIVQRKSEKASDNGSHKSGSGGTGSTPIQSISHPTRASHAIRNSEV